MFYFIAILTGLITSVMVTVNGELTAHYGLYSATLIIHIIGLVAISIILLIRREGLRATGKTKLWQYMGGVVGVAVTVFNNLAYGKISVSAIMALGLLGQSVISIATDRFGLFGMEKRPFRATKLISLAVISAGIIYMIAPLDKTAYLAAIVSLITGVLLVVTRSMNSALSKHRSVFQSTFFNYVTGLITTVVVLLILGRGEPMLNGSGIAKAPYLYLGGLMGVVIVSLLNVSVSKIPSLYMSLLSFTGQIFMGVAVDAFLQQGISMKNVIGGALVAFGMCIDFLFERKSEGVSRAR